MNPTQTFTYGLAGIELAHADERRDTEIHRAMTSNTLGLASHITQMRQRLGDAMIRLGSSLADAPPTDPGLHPRVEAP